MIRRNLLCAVLAVPVAVGSAAVLNGIDLGQKSVTLSQVDDTLEASQPLVLPTNEQPLSRPLLAVNEPADSDIEDPPEPAASGAHAPQSARRQIDSEETRADRACLDPPLNAGSQSTAFVVTQASAIVQQGDLAATSSMGRAYMSAGGGTAPRVSESGAPQIPQPSPLQAGAAHFARSSPFEASQSSTVAPRAGAMSLNADFWWFEPQPLSITFGEAASGQPVPMALQIIHSDAQSEIFACQVSVYAIGDDGEALGEVRPATDVLVSVDGESTSLLELLPLQPDELFPWLSQTQTFDVVVAGVGQGGGDLLISDNYLYMPVPSIIVTLTPDTNVQPGELVKVTIESDQPLGIALSGAKLRLNGGTQLLQSGQTVSDDGTASDVVVLLGDLSEQSSFVREEWFVAVDPAWAWMSVQLEAEEILPQYNGAELWNDGGWIDPGDDGDDDDIAITVLLTPDTDVQPGDLVKVTVQSDGPLAIALSYAMLRFNGGTQLLQQGQTVSEDGTVSDVVISLGDWPAESALLHEEWFVAVDPTWAGMSVQMEAQEIVPQYGWAELWNNSFWVEPADGVVERLDIN